MEVTVGTHNTTHWLVWVWYLWSVHMRCRHTFDIPAPMTELNESFPSVQQHSNRLLSSSSVFLTHVQPVHEEQGRQGIAMDAM